MQCQKREVPKAQSIPLNSFFLELFTSGLLEAASLKNGNPHHKVGETV
jgi:hypothetical protein